ncbi:MAG: hypothetical protein PVI86_01870 [Phycisphaerae bacterium]
MTARILKRIEAGHSVQSGINYFFGTSTGPQRIHITTDGLTWLGWTMEDPDWPEPDPPPPPPDPPTN